MNLERMPWLRFLSRAAVLCAMIFGTVRLALARDGVSGGAPRSFLTVSGVLTGVSGTPMATFRFSHGGAAAAGDGGVGGVLCAPTVPIADIDPATHAFSVEVPLDQPGHECPAALFDGSDAFVEVAFGATTVVARRAINPVPYARYAEHYGTPDCPVGYERNPATPAGRMYCRRRLAGGIYDEVVRVGEGRAAFWIDRYESSANYAPDGSGAWVFTSSDELPYFPRNGQWGQARDGHSPYALSVITSPPSLPATWITWFQAIEVCSNGGKQLAGRREWLLAAQGTPDTTEGCQLTGTAPRVVGAGGGCESSWGAQDMIGNVWEWTDEWYAGVGDDNALLAAQPDSEATWRERSLYRNDRTWNISSSVLSGTPLGGEVVVRGLPSAALRGGSYGDAANGGVFAMGLHLAPTRPFSGGGFRCVIPR